MVCLVLCSCSGRFDVKKLDNGYYHFKNKVDKDVIRWTLMLSSNNEERIITEALVVSNQVVTIMPTYTPWGRVATWHSDLVLDMHGYISLKLTEEGIFYGADGRLIATNREELMQFTKKWTSNSAIELYIELPVRFSMLEDSVDIFSSYVGKYGMFFKVIYKH